MPKNPDLKHTEEMPVLTELNLPNRMDTSSCDLIEDFFVPALTASVRYDRGVGFFSSAWLRINAAGMVAFSGNGGKARWVTSPILSEADWEALITGDKARHDPILRHALERNIQDLAQTLETETLSALSWMVSDGILHFKLALPKSKLDQGEFHDKFGIFTDVNGAQVSFNGSYNDSIQGIRNYESIKIFHSWSPVFQDLVAYDAQRFERLWNNSDPNVRVFDLPEAAQERILKLRKPDRPYPKPKWIALDSGGASYRPPKPILPERLTLRGYQTGAIDAWFAHDCRGLLEMATGTGKTIAALAASVRLYEREHRLAAIITVPYQHLVDQWCEEARSFGYRPVLAYRSKQHWLDELNTQVMDLNARYRQFISVITTHTTFITPEFQETIAGISAPALLIADEAHHLGAEQTRQTYPEGIPFRLALSATPDRWFDDAGTEALREYFGQTVYCFPLEKAIGISLTPYYYYPYLVPLTDSELEQYEALSARIARLVTREDDEGQWALKMLLIRRAELLNRAENKLIVLSSVLDELGKLDHALFYCAPGQIEDVLRLLGLDKGLAVHRFTAEEDTKKRQELLADFASGELQGLVAMKCLDEGVDVPTTQTAFMLASSSNPREFIQRRGRILRKASGKEYSFIYDLVAVPPEAWRHSQTFPTLDTERSILRKELQRFKEFAGLAQNKQQALDVVWGIAARYGLMDF